MSLSPTDFLIDDDFNDNDKLFNVTDIDGSLKGRGYVERDYKLYPEEYLASPGEMPLIPKSEWSDRIKEMEREGSRISDVRMRMNAGNLMPSLDQGPVGYCWAHSTTHTVMLDAGMRKQPYVPLSAYMVAAIIKGGRDEGGWCGLSAKFVREIGICSQKTWPQGSRTLSLDTPAMRAEAAKNKITEDWVDLTRAVYDQNLTFEQLATCLLSGIPCAVDFNWWGHSVCAMDLVEVEPGSFGIRILNSWSDGWGDKGMGVLRGSKALPNGAVATRRAGIAA